MEKVKKVEKYIPDELVREIFIRLPVKSLTRYKCISKSWYRLITDPIFIKLYNKAVRQGNKFGLVFSNHWRMYSIAYRINHESTTPSSAVYSIQEPTTLLSSDFVHHDWNLAVLGSYNGLLLLVSGTTFLGIWNPSTGDLKNITHPSMFPAYCREYSRALYGFGCDSNKNDYKIVVVEFEANKYEFDSVSNVKIFSMGSCTWKRVKDMSSFVIFNYVRMSIRFDCYGIFVNGAIHWLGTSRFNSIVELRLIAFDLGCQEFKEIPLLEDMKTNPFLYARLIVWKERMHLFIEKRGVEFSYDIFVMREYGVIDSWCKLYTVPEVVLETIPSRRCWTILCFIDDDKLLLEPQVRDSSARCYHLVLYDLKSCRFEELLIHQYLKKDLDDRYVFRRYCAIPYVPSLAPLGQPW